MRFAKWAAMTPAQVALVQDTWRKVIPVRDLAADLFYGKLFSLEPSAKVLFKGDMKEQGRNLNAMMSVAVSGLAKPEKILPAVRQLGRRHAAYGVRERHYALVGAALLWMLEKCLIEEFTPQVREAWTAAYELLAGAMQEAATPCASSP